MDLSTSRYGRLKYTIKLADIVALGAVLAGDIPLDNLPPGSVIHSYSIKASTAVAGPSIATAVAQLKMAANAIGGGTVNVFNTTGAPLLNTVLTGLSMTAANALALTLTLTGANANVATAGQIDVVINYHVLAP